MTFLSTRKNDKGKKQTENKTKERKRRRRRRKENIYINLINKSLFINCNLKIIKIMTKGNSYY